MRKARSRWSGHALLGCFDGAANFDINVAIDWLDSGFPGARSTVPTSSFTSYNLKKMHRTTAPAHKDFPPSAVPKRLIHWQLM
jgi:hypothetical protein